MKTAEQIIEEQCGTRKFRFHDVEGSEKSEFDVICAMEEYGKQMYNQALEDAVNKLNNVVEFGYIEVSWERIQEDVESLKK